MFTQSCRSLVDLPVQSKVIPAVENRMQFTHALDHSRCRVILLRHCNLFDFGALLENAYRRGYAAYVNVDQVDGIAADAAGLSYLAQRLHITGIVSNHPKVLALSKGFGLETIQRIFAVDSTGLETALESVDTKYVDLLDLAPALVIPTLSPDFLKSLPLPFIGSGLLSTPRHVEAVLHAGASAVLVIRPELWSS